MDLLNLINESTIKVPLSAGTRQTAIAELVDVLAEAGCISNAEDIKDAVWERELQRTTGIGEGLAIPHGRSNDVDGLVLAMGIPATPIDFASSDKRPVELVILLISPVDHTADHIQALGRISRLMVDRAFREAAFAATSAAELHTHFQGALVA
jgi:mannitol/fructose-specific phosphotransferase system IIA component (Ntr-type)